MTRNRIAFAVFLVLSAGVCAGAQEAPPPQSPVAPTAENSVPAPAVPDAASAATPAQNAADAAAPQIPLRVPKGLPLQVALDKEVRIHEAGQAIHGRTMQPVYAFDRVVIPLGTEVLGRIAKIEELSKKQKTFSALDADFTPNHKLELEFNELVLPDGKHIPIQTVVTRGTGQAMEFVRAKGDDSKNGIKSAASEKIDQAKQEAKRTWDEAKKQVEEPGRMHRLEHYLVAQLPFHPQYLDAGALYSAELQEPLDFGTTPLTTKLATSLARPTPPASLVHATLLTPLSSASSQLDEPVEAMLWQPLFDGDDLILPAGTKLKGKIIQVHPAYKMHHNGQLRIAFHDVETPDGLDQKVSAVMVGVTADKAEHVMLDSEGGAESTSPNTRYLSTAFSIGLAVVSSQTDSDAHYGGGAGGDASTRAAGGVGGFKLIGFTVGLFVHSQPLGLAMGALGAGRSIYTNFLGPGHEVVFPKDTPMEFSLSPEHAPPAARPADTSTKN